MTHQAVTVRRGGRIYRATWSLNQGYVKVLSAYGTAEARLKEDPETTAKALLERLLELWSNQPR